MFDGKSIFNNFKVHTQYSICEGAIKIEDLADYCKKNKIKSMGLSDSFNLCGALEFSEALSKVGTQPIIGSQINFKFNEVIGKLPIFAKTEKGYNNLVKLSSKSFLDNKENKSPTCSLNDLVDNNSDLLILSGGLDSLFGNLVKKNKLNDVDKLASVLKNKFSDSFYLEIQRHNDIDETRLENIYLNLSEKENIPIIASQEVFYINKDMYEAHDALICIKNKTYVNEKNRIKYSNQHYLKDNSEMSELFYDLPEALENNFNLPFRCSFKPNFSKPILPSISSSEKDPNEMLKELSFEGLKDKFKLVFGPQLGIIPDVGASWLVPNLIGRAKANGLALLGDDLDARKAFDWGLIWDVVSDEDLIPEATKIAKRIANSAISGLKAVVQAHDNALVSSLDEQLNYERDTQEIFCNKEEFKEGVRAFLEKRKPNFKDIKS